MTFTLVLFLILNIILFTLLYIVMKEIDRISSSRLTSETKSNFVICIFIAIDLVIWNNSDLNFLFYEIAYFYFLVFITVLNRKNLVIPTIIFLIINIFHLITISAFENPDAYLIVKLLEPFFVIMVIWISLRVKNPRAFLYFLSMMIIITSYIVIEAYLYSIHYPQSMEHSWWYYFFTIETYLVIQSILFYGVEYLYKNYFKRQINSQKNNNGFYKPYLKDLVVIKYLKENNYEFGAIVTIDIPTDDLLLEKDYILKEIVERVKIFYPKALFFQGNLRNYSFLLPIKNNELFLKSVYNNNFTISRDDRDFFNKLVLVNNLFKSNTLNVTYYVSIYGIENNNLNQLLKQNDFLKQNEANHVFKNPVIVYDSRLFMDYLIQKQKILDLLKTNTLRLNYTKRYILNGIFHEYSVNVIDKETDLNSDLKIHVNNPRFDYIYRYALINAIENYKKINEKDSMLIINVPFNWIINNYEYTKRKLKNLKMLNNVILNIDLFEINIQHKHNWEFLKLIIEEFPIKINDFSSRYIGLVLELDPMYFSKQAFHKIEMTKTKKTLLKNRILEMENYF